MHLQAAFDEHCKKLSQGVYTPNSGKIDSKLLAKARQCGAFGGSDSPDALQKTSRGFVVSWRQHTALVKIVLSVKHNAILVFHYVAPDPSQKKIIPQETPFGVVSAGMGWLLHDIDAPNVLAWCALVAGVPLPESATDEATVFMRRAARVVELSTVQIKTRDTAKRYIDAAKRSREMMKNATRTALRSKADAENAAELLLTNQDIPDEFHHSGDEHELDEEDNEQDDAASTQQHKRRREDGEVQCLAHSRNVYATVAAIYEERERLAQKARALLRSRSKHGRVSRDLCTVVLNDDVENNDLEE